MPVPKFNLSYWHFLIIQLQLISWLKTTLTTAVPDAKYTINCPIHTFLYELSLNSNPLSTFNFLSSFLWNRKS